MAPKRNTDVLAPSQDDVFADSGTHDPGKRNMSPTSEILDSDPDKEAFVDERTNVLSSAPVLDPEMRGSGDRYQEKNQLEEQYDFLFQRYEELEDQLAEKDDQLAAKDHRISEQNVEINELFVVNAEMQDDLQKARTRAKSLQTELSSMTSTVALKRQVAELAERVDTIAETGVATNRMLGSLVEMVESLNQKLEAPKDVKAKGPANKVLTKQQTGATGHTLASIMRSGGSMSVGDLLERKQPPRNSSPIRQSGPSTGGQLPFRPRSPDKGLRQRTASPGKPPPTSQGSPARHLRTVKSFGRRAFSLGKRNKETGAGEGPA